MSDRLRPEELAALEQRHRNDNDAGTFLDSLCNECEEEWPCPTSRLLAERQAGVPALTEDEYLIVETTWHRLGLNERIKRVDMRAIVAIIRRLTAGRVWTEEDQELLKIAHDLHPVNRLARLAEWGKLYNQQLAGRVSYGTRPTHLFRGYLGRETGACLECHEAKDASIHAVSQPPETPCPNIGVHCNDCDSVDCAGHICGPGCGGAETIAVTTDERDAFDIVLRFVKYRSGFGWDFVNQVLPKLRARLTVQED